MSDLRREQGEGDWPAHGPISYDDQDQWLIEDGAEGTARIVARDVPRWFGLLVVAALHPAAPPPLDGLREALASALAEFDNVSWDDIWQRVDASGEDELARMSEKYVGYVRADIEKALAALRAEGDTP